MFIGRKTEIGILENEYGREGSSLVIVYGRRRIGKTTLIKQFMQSKDSLYFLSTEEGGRQNLKYFQSLAFDKTALNLLSLKTHWNGKIYLICSQGPDKTVIAIDEYPYLAMTEPVFHQDYKESGTRCSKQECDAYLCGSLIGMMYSETLDYSSPLYGRRTAQIKLAQIPFTDFAASFQKKRRRASFHLCRHGRSAAVYRAFPAGKRSS
jgi:AAA+ ATPase superfamily predicted ATPase